MSGAHTRTTPVPASAAGLPAATRSGRAGRTLGADRLAAGLERRRVALRRVAGTFAAAAVAGAALSLTAAPGQAEEKKQEPGFVGYSTTTTATPMKIEIFEPTIPIPASPQAEVSVGYASVIADSAGSRARASYLWPGAPVGEGFKTIAEGIGLPPEIGEEGYPIQVNAIHPSGPPEDAEEPFPGMVQRAQAADDAASAENSYSTDAKTPQRGEDGDSSGGGGGGGGGPLPGLPGLPGPSGSSGLDLTGLGGGRSAGAASAPAAAPLLPEPLAALVDMGGFTAVAGTDTDTDAVGKGRSIASDITILDGLVTIDSVKTVAIASSDGVKGQGRGVATYGDLTAFGQRFAFGPDGFEATGAPAAPIPGLPDQAPAALEQLGLTITVPEPVYVVEGDAASTTMPGLIVDFDLTVLRTQLGPLSDALNEGINQIPDDFGQLKSLIQAAANLSPRIVFTLGSSFAGVDTSQAIDPPPLPEEPEEPTEQTGGATGGGSSAGSASGGTAPASPPADGAPVTDPVAGGDVPTTEAAIEPLSGTELPGLPPLFSFPGLLLYGGLIGAGIAGILTRRLGLMALGGVGSCTHGLDSGLPDLRKVT